MIYHGTILIREDYYMFKDKGIITEEEHILISRYHTDIQNKLRDKLLKAKEMPKSFSYDSWIDNMEQGLEISYNKTDKGQVISIGKPNTARLARMLVEMSDGVKIKPLKEELEHDGRLEEFQKYPKGTRVKANGEVVES